MEKTLSTELKNKNKHYLEEYTKTSSIQKKFNEDYLFFESNYIDKFKNRVKELLEEKNIINNLGLDSMENLHDMLLNDDMRHYDDYSGVNEVGKSFYDLDTKLEKIYHEFIVKELVPFFGFDFYFQKQPTIRFHFPDSKNSDHYPRWHSDIQYGHPPMEINALIPLTLNKDFGFRFYDVKNSSRIYKNKNYNLDESLEEFITNKELQDKLEQDSFKGVENMDSVLFFDARCLHTAIKRDDCEKNTRGSIDFRIYPKKDYDENSVIYKGSGRMQIEYSVGVAYHELTAYELAKTMK
tara:strand:+ start:5130 stop:6014 length:885 start_codon:yes stop_codon:yes gene_type:complete